MKGRGTASAVEGLNKHYFVMLDINPLRDFRYVPLELDMCFALDMLPCGNEIYMIMHQKCNSLRCAIPHPVILSEVEGSESGCFKFINFL